MSRFCLVAVAQTPPPSGGGFGGADTTGGLMLEIDAVREQDLQIKRMEAEARQKNKAQARTDVEDIIASTGLSCRVRNAELVGVGEMMENGKKVPTRIYEVACVDGVGYILQPQGGQQPRIVSCFEASVLSSSSKAKPGSAFSCQLPENADIKANAAFLLS
ncbi:MAG TPA: hypothetical protein VHL14_08425, partial [Steroidobacteraceae bacterium]|nr:hypothetical protein [Steroidobacteraceae bacterium]